MYFRNLFIVVCILSSFALKSQDVLVKRDSSKVIVQVLEIHPTQIQYKSFENQTGPTYIIDKNEIAYINYTNGTQEVFQLSLEEQPTNNLVIEKPKDTFVKFNVQLGAVVNNAYCNFDQRTLHIGQGASENYSGNNDEKYFANINIGFNFLFGNNYKTKTVLGINYLRSKGEYVYNYYGRAGSTVGAYATYESKLKYVSEIDFINIVFGYRFQIGKHLQLEPLIAFNIQASGQRIGSGTNVKTDNLGGPNNIGAIVETEYITNKKYSGSDINQKLLLSFCPKISYEFKIKDKIVGCYLSYNLNRNYKLPWYLIGFTYYPFKKASTVLGEKRVRILTKIKVNTEVGVTLNNSSTNMPKIYSNPLNKNIQTGANFGINIISGENPKCKHLIGVSIVQSKTEFMQNRYPSDYIDTNNRLISTIKKTNYKSDNYFLTFSTGIRCVLGKHVNIDNSIIYYIPMINYTKIVETNYIEESTKNANGQYVRTNYTEMSNSRTSTIPFIKPSFGLSPKLSYDFNVKEQVFGIFYNFNIAFKQNIQWHLIGITYYPFKKLR